MDPIPLDVVEALDRVERLLPVDEPGSVVRAALAFSRSLSGRLASSLPGDSDRARLAGLLYVADAVSTLAIERGLERGETELLLDSAAKELGHPPAYVRSAVFLRTIRDPRLVTLPTRSSVELLLSLLVMLTNVVEAGVWTAAGSAKLRCLIHVGDGGPTRRMRLAAKSALSRGQAVNRADRALVRAVPVERWAQPFAALVFRTTRDGLPASLAFAQEAAAALALALERETLLERSMTRERSLVEAGERRLVRLGFDIHDGPIQEIAALAGDLHLFRRQLSGVLPSGEYEPLLGRVDDLEARLKEVDRELRELAQSLESPSILRRPLEAVLRREVDSFAAASEIAAELELDGDFGRLTPSQRIALMRVVQEALTNAREHSGATHVKVTVAVRSGYVQAAITDNGRGFDVERALVRAARGGRLGLVGMSERIRLLGGTLDLRSRVGGPTTVAITLPEWRPAAGEEPTAPAVKRL